METAAGGGCWLSNGDAAASQHEYPSPGEVRTGLGGRIPPCLSRDVAELQSKPRCSPGSPPYSSTPAWEGRAQAQPAAGNHPCVFPLGWGRMLPAGSRAVKGPDPSVPALRGWGQHPFTPTACLAHSHARGGAGHQPLPKTFRILHVRGFSSFFGAVLFCFLNSMLVM